MDQYAHKDACSVDRDLEQHPGMAVLMTCDGDSLLWVPADEWTDTQIFTALDFANAAFGRGKMLGRQEKAREIRRALGLDN